MAPCRVIFYTVLNNNDISPTKLLGHLTVDLGFTAILSSKFFFFLSFVSYPPSLLNEPQPKHEPHVRNECDLKSACPKSGVSPPLKVRAQKPPIFNVFRRFHSLTATLAGYIFGVKHDIHYRASALETAEVSYTSSQIS